MEIKLLVAPTDDDWMLVKRCALVTVGKTPVEPPTDEWKRRMLEARHSPIRELKFVFELKDIPYWVSTHLVRHHVGCQPYVRSQRNDRQSNYDRTKAPQDAPVDMIWSLNADALITIAQKRLCTQAAKETREVVEAMCISVLDECPEFSYVLKPICAWTNGICHELNPCGRWELYNPVL